MRQKKVLVVANPFSKFLDGILSQLPLGCTMGVSAPPVSEKARDEAYFIVYPYPPETGRPSAVSCLFPEEKTVNVSFNEIGSAIRGFLGPG